MAAGSDLDPGEGIAKRSLPDSHTDFVFAVAAEEFGIILCLALLALFAFVVSAPCRAPTLTEDMFSRFEASGLAILFGVQAAINMSVNSATDTGQGHDAAVHLLWRAPRSSRWLTASA